MPINFMQACVLMGRGMSVFRSGWSPTCGKLAIFIEEPIYWCTPGTIILDTGTANIPYEPSQEDIVATDWDILTD